MDTTAQFITYSQTGVFSKIVTDYISGSSLLQPFYTFPVSVDGIKAAVAEHRKYPTDRILLHTVLKEQYSRVTVSDKVKANIDKLLDENTFTVTTAHQPNIFTGHLYFIYKILHAVKLAEFLNGQVPGCNFVPVYYMGSEDADLDELGHVYIGGEKLQWQTSQTGAVGRMKVDKALVKLVEQLGGQLLTEPFGASIISLTRDCYKEGVTIEQATFSLVNELFKAYGLVVLLPDNAALKKAFIPVIEKELEEGFSHKAVEATVSSFPKEYKVQAGGRELNLFYLTENSRERIVSENSKFKIQNSKIGFDKTEIIKELQQHPERFSPNVILRPVLQELLLPNIAFIGGGGELAYWLELKKVFEAAGVPYPVLVLRNSFLFVEKKYQELCAKMGFGITDLFKPETDLVNELVKRETTVQLGLENEIAEMKALYGRLKKNAGAVNSSLAGHTEALQVKAIKRIETLQQKMLRAEKKKFEARQRQLHKLKAGLFPNNNLQERIENILPYYAKWGSGFIEMLYNNSPALEQQFGILLGQ